MMKELMHKLTIAFACMVIPAFQVKAQLSVAVAQCEKKTNPMGVATSGIHFNWQLTAKVNNQVQQSYQIGVSSSKQNLLTGKYDVWNSGVVKSRQSIFIAYEGNQLKSGEKYYWRVKVWGKNNKSSAWSTPQYFVTGLAIAADWKTAKWIGFEELPDSMTVTPGNDNPSSLGNKLNKRSIVPLFRKDFTATKKIKQALVFISGVGQYELSINGNKTGDNFMAPGWTYYDKKCLYNVYDITRQLVRGKNTAGVIVGNGFFYINRERYIKMVVGFGFPKMICNIKIVYTDGTQQSIVSDESWKTAASPVTYTSIYGGEDYDAQLEQNGWDKPLFNDAGWKQSLVVKTPAPRLEAEQDYPVKIMDSFSAKKILQPASGGYIYDFAHNISGIAEIKVKGKKGQTIKLTPGELLNKKQLPNQAASGDPFYYTYTLKGNGVETWRPKFTFYGFRYVLVEGAAPAGTSNNNLPVVQSMVSLHNRNSAPATGNFECANPLFNQINELIRWAIKSNLQSVVTDCPHREKLSWLEQVHLMGNSIHYNYDVYHLFKKLVQDMQEAQLPNGLVPDIAPELVVFGGGFRDSPEWGSSSIIVPWLIYNLYGDEQVIKDAWPMMKKYVSYLESKATDNIVSHGLGDWYDYGPLPPGVAQLTPKALTATAIYYYDVLLLQKMAALQNLPQEEQAYQVAATAIKNAFNKKFFNTVTKVYSTGSQTAMAMPLCVGLVDEADRKKVVQNLVDSIYKNNKALTAGDVGFHYLVQALDEGGASQLLYDMNNRNDVAGYGYQLKKGATALTESWAALEEVSNNHLMLGHIMEWFYSGLAGIGQEKNSIAFNHIKIRPQPVGDVSSAAGSFNAPYGLIKTAWKKENKKFLLHTEIPVNTTANVYLPATVAANIYLDGVKLSSDRIKIGDDGATIEVGSGKYDFEVRE